MQEWHDDEKVIIVYNFLKSKTTGYERKYRGEVLEANEFYCSISEISKGTGLSTMSIRTAIDKLEKTNYISRKTSPVKTKWIIHG